MNYESWLETVPEAIRDDALWKLKVYRLALFAADIGWFDVTKLNQDRRTRSVADQLYRSLGSISANIAEGYSRGSGKDRVRFYEYSVSTNTHWGLFVNHATGISRRGIFWVTK